MSNASGKSRFPIDAALILTDTTAAPATATVVGPDHNLVTTGAYWQNPADTQDGSIELVAQFGAFVGTGVTVSIDVYTKDASGNAKLFGSFPQDSGAVAEIALDTVGMLKRHPAAVTFHAQLTIAGTSPQVSAFVYLSTRSPI